MVTRAGLSESVFCEVFPTVAECYSAAFEKGVSRLSRAVDDAAAREQSWLARVRAGVVALLGFLDDEPQWARLLVVEGPVSGALALECTQRLHEVLSRLLDHGAATGQSSRMPVLTGDLVVGAVFSVIRTNMLERADGKLVELAPALMAFIVTPYLGQAAAQAELEGRPVDRRAVGTGEERAKPGVVRAQEISRTAELPVRATHRTTLVLRAIAHAPYSNNREVAQAAGLVDEGQASKLLARLERKGVIENVGVGAARGEPNAWLLTASGRRAVELLGDSFGLRARATRMRAGGTA